MWSAIRFLIRFIERLSNASGLVIAWVVLPLIIATCYEVFSRYVLNEPTIWAFELGYMAMGTHALIGTAYTLRERGHIRIDVLSMRFSERTRAIVDLIGYLVLFLPVMSWLSYALWDYWVSAMLSGERSGQSAWNPVIWPFRLCFFIGIGFLFLQGVAELLKTIGVLRGERHLSAGSTHDEGL
jgi:TRAP-type mannitol/chloroaromatic compound transport system permease small subunit